MRKVGIHVVPNSPESRSPRRTPAHIGEILFAWSFDHLVFDSLIANRNTTWCMLSSDILKILDWGIIYWCRMSCFWFEGKQANSRAVGFTILDRRASTSLCWFRTVWRHTQIKLFAFNLRCNMNHNRRLDHLHQVSNTVLLTCPLSGLPFYSLTSRAP
jgi:hypothetical protein